MEATIKKYGSGYGSFNQSVIQVEGKEIGNKIDDIEYQWTSYHTFTIICLRLCGDLMMKATLIFDDELSTESSTSLSTFSYVNMCQYFGVILSMFLAPLNKKYFDNNNKTITVIYALSSGIIIILFGITYFINLLYLNPTKCVTLTIISQCIVWGLYGISFSIYNAGTIAVSTQYSDPTNHGRILSLISISWSISSLFYVVVAYLIKIHPSTPFIVFGSMLILFSFLVHFTYKFDAIHPKVVDSKNENENASMNIRELFYVFKDNHYRTLICISCMLSLSSGANLAIVGSPLLHNLYDLNISKIGWCTLITFLGEFTSNLYMVKYSDKQGFYLTASIGLVLKIIAGILMIFISIYHNSESFINLCVALFLIFLVFFSWETFFVSQLAAINKAVDINSIHKHIIPKRIVFLVHNSMLSISKTGGIWFAASIWNNGQGLIYVGFLLVSTSVMGMITYCVYYVSNSKMKTYQKVETTDMNGIDTVVDQLSDETYNQ